MHRITLTLSKNQLRALQCLIVGAQQGQLARMDQRARRGELSEQERAEYLALLEALDHVLAQLGAE